MTQSQLSNTCRRVRLQEPTTVSKSAFGVSGCLNKGTSFISLTCKRLVECSLMFTLRYSIILATIYRFKTYTEGKIAAFTECRQNVKA